MDLRITILCLFLCVGIFGCGSPRVLFYYEDGSLGDKDFKLMSASKGVDSEVEESPVDSPMPFSSGYTTTTESVTKAPTPTLPRSVTEFEGE